MTSAQTLFNSPPEHRATEGLKTVLLGGASIYKGWLGYGAALNEIKARHPGKAGERAFGEAVNAAGLDVWPEDDVSQLATHPILRDARSAAMWAATLTQQELVAHMAAHPNVEVTAKGGFRGLHAAVQRASKQADKREVAKVGQDTPASETASPSVDGEGTYQQGYLAGIEAAKAAGFYLDPESLPKSAQEKLEAFKRQTLKKTQAELQNLVEDEVTLYIREVLRPQWQANLDHADKISRAHRGVMTKAEYNVILACLHPDSRLSVSDAKLAEAFRIMRSKEIPLLPGDATTPTAPPLPTREEMIAMRRARKMRKAA